MTARARIASVSLVLVSASGCTNKPVDLGYDDAAGGTGAAPSAAGGSGGAASSSTTDAGKSGANGDAGARTESGGSSGADASQPHDAAAAGSSDGGTGAAAGTQHSGGSATGGSSGSGGAGSGGDADKGGSTGAGGSASGGSSGRGGAGSGGDPAGQGGGTGTGGRPTGGGAGSGGDTESGGKTASGGSATGGSSGSGGATTGGTTSAGGVAGSGGGATGGSANITGPCDIYAAASPATPCVAAYSTTRLLYSKYSGPLYQIRAGGDKRGTGGTLQDIWTTAEGFADAATVDTACGTSECTVSILYDQSGHGNDLKVAPAGCYPGTASEPDYESRANKLSLKISGHKVYGLYMDPHEGYRNNATSGMATGDASQGIYELVDGTRYGTGCCWEFGNASTDNCDFASSSSAIFFGVGTWGNGGYGGPWFFLDIGAAPLMPAPDPSLGCGDPPCGDTPPPMSVPYALGIVKNMGGSPRYAIKVGDARAGSLTTAYDGSGLGVPKWQLGGGIILGIGSDNSNSSQGTFFEGAITAGWPSDQTDDLVLENVQAAKYGQ
ncbi:MAG: hypothetical protein JW940_36720 [Polyangiaceae bacterium]|nr:hypothetical protein [Polyangiaceae bacterium]